VIAPAGMPALTKAAVTAAARRCDKAWLKAGEPVVSVWPVTVTVELVPLAKVAAACWILAVSGVCMVELPEAKSTL